MVFLKSLRGGQRVLVTLVVVAAIFGVASAVQAAIPDAAGVIHGCYHKKSGQLRVIDTDNGQACKANAEMPLNWNVEGVPGAPGAPGAPGMSGYERVTALFNPTATAPTVSFSGQAECPAGKRVVGGGGAGTLFNQNGSLGDADLIESFPNPAPERWIAGFQKRDGSAFAVGEGVSFTVWAICVNVSA